MATTKEREQFVAFLQKELSTFPPAVVEAAARLILRHAATHGRLATEACNGHPAQSSPTMDARELGKLQEKRDARIEREEKRIEARIAEICKPFGIRPDFGGDPRGYTVKLHLANGKYNTWGGEESGYGVPQ